MKPNILVVLRTTFFFCFFVFSTQTWAVRQATIVGSEVEVYSKSDFDSDIIATVREGEKYSISDSTYGPFYRIKLKDGIIGYIVDYELDIAGIGRFQEKDLDAILYDEAKKASAIQDSGDREEVEVFGRTYGGPSVHMVNFHESAFGSDQVDDLPAVGYKKIADIAWSILGTFKVPKYYAARTGGTASGFKLWADLGISNNIVDFGGSQIRFAPAFFTHFSLIQLDTPTKKYALHDVSAGVMLEFGWLIKLPKSAIDLGIKYYFDKSNYAGMGLSYLF